MRVLVILTLCLAVAAGHAKHSQRIIGGELTTITQYPFGAALLFSWVGVDHWQSCGGTIINNRAILSAAHCFAEDPIQRWRIRVGSSFASSGGVVHNTQRIIVHPSYYRGQFDNDIGILHSATEFVFNNNVQVGRIAGSNYNIADNSVVWAIGWGRTSHPGGSLSEQLRHVQIWTVNQEICRVRYLEQRLTITENMLCAGWLDVGGRDQCTNDSGGPLLHNNVVVGICSHGYQCATPRYPGVNTRVSRYTAWVQANA